MNSAKVTILEETLEKKFDIEQFKKFTREFFNELEMYLQQNRQTSIWKEYSDYISAYYKVGKYIDCDDKEIGIIAVELKEEKSVERARSMQRNFVSKVLDDNSLDAAIVAFYSESEASWRLSFVRLDYTFTEKGLTEELTPAKRYSYLVGEKEPIHTAKAQLLPIFENDMKNPTLDEIEEAFSVETVTKEFFNEYKEKYLEVKEYLESNEEFIKEAGILKLETAKFSEQFAKKLMGQLAFLYFLQKKGWLGVGIVPKTISRSELIEVYKTVDDTKKEILKKVYYKINDELYRIDSDLLASDEFDEHKANHLSDIFIKNEKYNKKWGTGDKTFIRDVLWKHCNMNDRNFFDEYLEPFFYQALNNKRKNQYFKTFNSKIPFLNGGLFEPLEGYHWKDTNFKIPNEIFSNLDEKGKRGSNGILDIFDRYNFTINENEPLEKDVAVDPEMLGKIFENLLDVKDRKSKGAFYTPREIVHYMCQESLINYLVNEVDVPYEDMKEFILYGEIIRDADSRSGVGYGKEFTIKQSIFDNIVAIDNALENVKVADPAVGSGAFPLGMLNEIVRARDNITEYIIRVYKELPHDERYREEYIRKNRSSYKMKWDTIKNSIFAVDIEPSAVDITKLRLWLSVVVDQKIEDEIKGPHQLPNLDMNIHVGNSLIDEFEGIKLFDETILTKIKNDGKEESTSGNNMQLGMLVDNTEEIIKEMFELQDKYFNEEGEEKKKEIKKEIENKQEQLIRYKLYEDKNTEGLEKYDESLKNKTKPYFIWELEFARVFKEKGGFDIVVGNPPYVGESGNKDIFRPIAKTTFGKKHYVGKMDLFYFFFHIALDIGNENCEIAFITTNYYPTASGAKKLREDLKERSYIRSIVNFNELKIFDSAKGQHNIITALTKKKDIEIKAYNCSTNRVGDADSDILNMITSWEDKESIYYEVDQNNIYEGNENYIRISGVKNDTENSIDSILNKIVALELRLGDIADINQGLVSGCDYISGRNIKKLNNSSNIENKDGIFVLDLENDRDVNVIEKLSLEEKKLLRPFFKNSEINKYYCNQKPKKVVLYLSKETKSLKLFPNIQSHLERFLPILRDRREVKSGSIKYFHLQWARNESIFIDKKIVVPYRTKKNTFAYNDIEWFCRSDAYVITEKDVKYKLKYLLALLNSKPYYMWLYYKGKRKGEILELFQTPLSEIPIKSINGDKQKEFIATVDKILDITTQEGYLTNMEKQNIVSNYEAEIDSMVYKLFEFTKEEIDIIEQHYKR